MMPRELKVGDVVQISPSREDLLFGGCFMLVTEPRGWGAQGFILIPEAKGQEPGKAYFRAAWAQMEYVGPAAFVPGPEGEPA